MSENGKGEFWAFVAGVLAGGIVALLYAPAKGSETREKIRETAGELKTKGGEIVSHVREEAGKAVETGRQKLEETRQRLEGAGQRLEATAQKVRDRFDAAVQKGPGRSDGQAGSESAPAE